MIIYIISVLKGHPKRKGSFDYGYYVNYILLVLLTLIDTPPTTVFSQYLYSNLYRHIEDIDDSPSKSRYA